MGCYDTVTLKCPKCGADYEAQTKGGDCLLKRYTPEDAPDDVLSDVNRHAPFTCFDCGHVWSYEGSLTPNRDQAEKETFLAAFRLGQSSRGGTAEEAWALVEEARRRVSA